MVHAPFHSGNLPRGGDQVCDQHNLGCPKCGSDQQHIKVLKRAHELLLTRDWTIDADVMIADELFGCMALLFEDAREAELEPSAFGLLSAIRWANIEVTGEDDDWTAHNEVQETICRLTGYRPSMTRLEIGVRARISTTLKWYELDIDRTKQDVLNVLTSTIDALTS